MDFLRVSRGALTIVFCLAFGASVLTAQQTIEPDIKATFLYNFTRFIEWPGPAPATSTPFRVCVVADRTMEEAIGRTVQGEFVQGRPLVMTRPQTSQEAQECQILFVGRSEQQRAAPLLTALRDLPVLVVGDSPQFIERGGAIQFVLVDNRVRFDVHLPNAQRAQLRLSANLLRVARKVEPNR